MAELCNRIKPKYDFLIAPYNLRNKKRSFGEIDILAVKGINKDIYEVKCSFRIVKARKQLKRFNKFVKANNAFFYCGSADKLEKISLD